MSLTLVFNRKYRDCSFKEVTANLFQGFNQLMNVNAYWRDEIRRTDTADILFDVGTAYMRNEFWSMSKSPKIRAGYCLWECTGIPKFFYKAVKNLDVHIVPSRWLYEIFTNSGCTDRTNTFIVPHGVNTELFKPINRSLSRKPYNILDVSVVQYRKGHDVLLKAFTELSDEMPGELHLTIKGTALNSGSMSAGLMKPYEGRKDITWINGRVSHEQLVAIYHAADLFVHPHRGEGFGMTPMEAMRTGLPVITTGYSGVMEYCNPMNSYLIKHREVDVPERSIYEGKWAEPDLDDLKKLIMKCYYHRELAAEKGQYAARELEGWTWKWSAGKIIDAILGFSAAQRLNNR